MPRRSLYVLIALMGIAPAAHAASPTNAQKCESAMELASAKYAQCRLNAESKYSKTLDAAKRMGRPAPRRSRRRRSIRI